MRSGRLSRPGFSVKAGLDGLDLFSVAVLRVSLCPAAAARRLLIGQWRGEACNIQGARQGVSMLLGQAHRDDASIPVIMDHPSRVIAHSIGCG
jgi:hypothetical protein